MEWAHSMGAVERFGAGRKNGSWYPTWNEGTFKPFSAWTDGMIAIEVWRLRAWAGFDEASFLADLRHRLEEAGLTISGAKDSPSVRSSALVDSARRGGLLTALAWVIAEHRP